MIFAMLKHAMLIVANRGGGSERERENFFPKHTPPLFCDYLHCARKAANMQTNNISRPHAACPLPR